jgi:Tol biopolymer transport system component
MALSAGAKLGPYEIVGALGAGGMGEVYRARDTHLKREIAIKVLPDLFTIDPDRLARFRREAQVLASLNHPNIAAIYGFQESGGVQALVLELIEGPTLADRIAQGPIPLDEALRIAEQIAEALEAAHKQGIIHRDLKPANIKLRPDGAVKVLDFGLAKALEPAPISGDLSHSPTITSPALTRMGVILGTAAYMSPEQAKGRAADKSSDLWAFGCVLYEMLTGRMVFEGDTIGDVLAGVLKTEPDWRGLPTGTPDAIRRLLRRCLQKDDKLRLRDAGDARLEIDEARSEFVSPPTAVEAIRGRERFAWIAAVGVLSLVAAALIAKWVVRPTPSALEVRFEIDTPSATDQEDLGSLAVSPDGRMLVFVATQDGQPHLWVRRIDSFDLRALPGTAGGVLPFWSPDSRSVAFFAEGLLKRVDLNGGPVRTLVGGATGGGGTWNRDGVILFARNPASPILRTSADGGVPTEVTRLEAGHAGHGVPHFLPDGRHYLYFVRGTPEAGGVYVGQLDAQAPRKLFDAESAAVYAAGHLVFIQQGTVFAWAFDPERLAPKGTAFPIIEGAVTNLEGGRYSALSAGAAGTIAFRAGSARAERQLVWFDRSGKEIETVGGPDRTTLRSPSRSPDGRYLAVLRRVNGNADIWLLELRGARFSKFTDHPAEDIFPVWSRDGSRIAFTSNRNGEFGLYQKRTTGGGEELLLPRGREEIFACDWSPDGQYLLYQKQSAERSRDFWALPLLGGGKPFSVGQTEFEERDGQFHPGGKWIAFHSNRSGRFEVYIQPFPGPGEPRPVSTNGGAQARWRSDGRELFYVALDGKLIAVPINIAADSQTVDVGLPVPLFAARLGRRVVSGGSGAQYVVSDDGQRFLMNTVVPEANRTPIRVLVNWRPQP